MRISGRFVCLLNTQEKDGLQNRASDFQEIDDLLPREYIAVVSALVILFWVYVEISHRVTAVK